MKGDLVKEESEELPVIYKGEELVEHKSANILNNSLPSAVKDPELGKRSDRPPGLENYEPKNSKRVASLRAAVNKDKDGGEA